MTTKKTGSWGAVVALAAFLTVSAPAQPQVNNLTKHLNIFNYPSTGVDFYAESKPDVVPFEKLVAGARQRLAVFLGGDLARGAIAICSTLEQKDSVSEPKLLRMGYRWVLVELTPGAAEQQLLARIKGESGGEIPPGLQQRMQNRSPEMRAAGESRLVSSIVQKMAYATILTTLVPDKPFRSSRVDDLARSPLPDWIDVGLASYAAGGPGFNLRFLKERIDEAFPLEDVLAMSRPFVAPASGGGPVLIMQGGPPGGGGGGHVEMPVPGPGGEGTRGGDSGGRGRGGGANLSKDVQDRMMFDAEASSFFSYLVAKVGVDKVKEIVNQSLKVRNSLDVLSQSGAVDKDFEKVEQDWLSWLKEQKTEGLPGNIRVLSGPDRPPDPRP